MSLPDVQALPDARGVALDAIDVEGLHYPVLICDGQGREAVAQMTTSVDAASNVKGAQQGRFVEVLHAAFAHVSWVAPDERDLHG
ncbi:GTP cyclohydrolase, FolE2/MptA family [Micromonospora sp. NPDC048930]|uniref:GTP cyclohydrolase, FolE2/MptA family n=1 Tax=Micromonospora sp. NPDC048930 TaxID=3364261 RepID=UPI003720C8F6